MSNNQVLTPNMYKNDVSHMLDLSIRRLIASLIDYKILFFSSTPNFRQKKLTRWRVSYKPLKDMLFCILLTCNEDNSIRTKKQH